MSSNSSSSADVQGSLSPIFAPKGPVRSPPEIDEIDLTNSEASGNRGVQKPSSEGEDQGRRLLVIITHMFS
jgi:hypothetical protein